MKQGAADGRVELRFGRSMHLSQKLQKSRGSEAIAARCRGGRETGAEAAIVEMTDTAECARGSSGGTMGCGIHSGVRRTFAETRRRATLLGRRRGSRCGARLH